MNAKIITAAGTNPPKERLPRDCIILNHTPDLTMAELNEKMPPTLVSVLRRAQPKPVKSIQQRIRTSYT